MLIACNNLRVWPPPESRIGQSCFGEGERKRGREGEKRNTKPSGSRPLQNVSVLPLPRMVPRKVSGTRMCPTTVCSIRGSPWRSHGKGTLSSLHRCYPASRGTSRNGGNDSVNSSEVGGPSSYLTRLYGWHLSRPEF